MKSEKHSEKNVKLIVELPQSLRKELKSRAALEELPIKTIVINKNLCNVTFHGIPFVVHPHDCIFGIIVNVPLI